MFDMIPFCVLAVSVHTALGVCVLIIWVDDRSVSFCN